MKNETRENGVVVFSIENEKDRVHVMKLAKKIIPLFKGYTMLQIEKGLQEALEVFKETYIIK